MLTSWTKPSHAHEKSVQRTGSLLTERCTDFFMYRAKPFIESEQGRDEMEWLCVQY
jgi:hypothetical protein